MKILFFVSECWRWSPVIWTDVFTVYLFIKQNVLCSLMLSELVKMLSGSQIEHEIGKELKWFPLYVQIT